MKWRAKHTKILALTQKETPVEEIAKAVGLTPQGVTWIRSQTVFREKLAEFNDKLTKDILEASKVELSDLTEAREVLAKKAVWASKKMVALARKGTGQERIQYEACKDILDRAGLKPKEVIETTHRDYSEEEVQRALTTLRELKDLAMRTKEFGSRFVLDNKRAARDPVADKGPDEGTEITSADRQTPLST